MSLQEVAAGGWLSRALLFAQTALSHMPAALLRRRATHTPNWQNFHPRHAPAGAPQSAPPRRQCNPRTPWHG
jgi:hypothetical protein